MRTFHIGGAAAAQLEESELKLNYDAYILSLPEYIIEKEVDGIKKLIIPRKSYIRVHKIITNYSIDDLKDKNNIHNLDNKEFLSETPVFTLKDGTEVKFGKKTKIVIKDNIVYILESTVYEYPLKVGSYVYYKTGDIAKKGSIISEFDPYNEVLVSEHDGILDFVTEVIDGVEEKNKNILIIKDDEGKEIERFVLVQGTKLEVSEGSRVSKGDIIARRPVAKRKTKDIIGGLPRVTELFESRKPKNAAVIAKVNGIVENIELKKEKYFIYVKAKNGKIFPHLITSGKNIYVKVGDRVQAGEPLCEGVISPHDILKVLGYTTVNEFLLNEIQSVYRLQGVDINEKHISVIIRQMLKKVEVVHPGDTEFIVGQNVEKSKFYKENEFIIKQGGQPAKARPILMGLTKASLYTESFLSAASFQETPRVLSIAALKNAVDKLIGLKENLVIGQLIPAGTGIKYYKNIKIKVGA